MRTDPDWRTRHCAEPVAEAISAWLGHDIWQTLGGCPRSPRQAAELYRRFNVRTLKDLMTTILGEPISPLEARRGDVCMVDNALGLCRGEWVECIDRMQPLERAECAWRIG